jgi:antitoxin ParD1/3/4
MTSLNISLPEPLKEFIQVETKRGGFSTPSEYVRHLLREAQKRQAEEHLERLLLEGMKSGKPISRKVVMERLEKKSRARLKKSG